MDSKKRRRSMLDTLAAASTAPPAPSAAASASGSPQRGLPAGPSGNRALRSARQAVDAHHVWDLDPALIDDTRITDRLDLTDIADLRASIEANGQSVPILVRRNPAAEARYLLIYGRRRLEAIRASDTITTVRALVTMLDDSAAVRAQISENTGRRDLSYIERALFAHDLLQGDFGTQAQVAEVLNTSKSGISMALSVARAVGPALARAVGPAHGIGRPRWETLAKAITDRRSDTADLCEIATTARQAPVAGGNDIDPSISAFEAVARSLAPQPTRGTSDGARKISTGGETLGTVARTKKGVRLEFRTDDDAFADWLETQSEAIFTELLSRWQDATPT